MVNSYEKFSIKVALLEYEHLEKKWFIFHNKITTSSVDILTYLVHNSILFTKHVDDIVDVNGLIRNDIIRWYIDRNHTEIRFS